jgi:hypothetical protein
MDQTDKFFIFIIAVTGGIFTLLIGPVLENVYKIRFAEELILVITIFVGSFIMNKRKKRKISLE